jgi:hypothetical protein
VNTELKNGPNGTNDQTMTHDGANKQNIGDGQQRDNPNGLTTGTIDGTGTNQANGQYGNMTDNQNVTIDNIGNPDSTESQPPTGGIATGARLYKDGPSSNGIGAS